MVVQRMSADVSGKQQKYTRIGPQEYVPFEHEDITIANIKDACKKHFSPQIEKDLICDVLAGDTIVQPHSAPYFSSDEFLYRFFCAWRKIRKIYSAIKTLSFLLNAPSNSLYYSSSF